MAARTLLSNDKGAWPPVFDSVTPMLNILDLVTGGTFSLTLGPKLKISTRDSPLGHIGQSFIINFVCGVIFVC